MWFDWIQLRRRPTEVLPTATEDQRGQIRVLTGDGATTADTLNYARNSSGTMGWVALTTGGPYQPLDADLTVIAGLVDPNADRILFWDDSAGSYAYLTAGTNLTITGTTIDAASGGGGTVATTTLAFGTTLVTDKSFTVTNASILSTSKITASISSFTGFARDMDEVFADPILITCSPAAGSMTVRAHGDLGRVNGDYPLVYSIGA